MFFKRGIIVCFLIVVTSCSTTTKTTEDTYKDISTFYFFRHAEKAKDDPRDPNLTTLGKQRALQYIDYFKKIKVDAIYSTNFKRTLHTVQPLANNRGLTPVIYHPYEIDMKEFTKENKNKTVLVVGHSNTTPNLVNKIIGKLTYSQMTDENYSSIYKVMIKDSIITSELLRMD